MWAFSALGCALLASALLLRRWPLTALAVTLCGAVAIQALAPLRTSTILMVLASAAGIEICYIAATRTLRVSAAAVAMAGAGLLALPLGPTPAPAHPLTPLPRVYGTSFGGALADSVLPSRSLPGSSDIQSGRHTPRPSCCAPRRPPRP
jgi:hypothetical protein